MDTHRSRRRTLPVHSEPGKKPDETLTPLDVAETLHVELERIDALASVVAERLQDLGCGRVAERRFCRLVGILADACEEAHAAGSEAIGRITRASRAAP